MRSPKSKHQGRYQWSEIQELVRVLAQRYDRPQEGDTESSEGKLMSTRVLREQSLRATRPIRERDSSRPIETTITQDKRAEARMTAIDLNDFRDAWKRSQGVELSPVELPPVELPPVELPPAESSKTDSPAIGDHHLDNRRRRDLESPQWSDPSVKGDRPDQVNHAKFSPSGRERRTSRSSESPWEQLRDHFIMLREARIRAESLTERAIKVDEQE